MKINTSLKLNLLPNQAKFQADRMKLQAIIGKYVKWALILWIGVSILVAIVYFGSDFVLGVENKKYETALNDYKSMATEVVAGQLLKFRAKVLGQVLKDRFEYSTAFEKVNSLFGDEIKVINFDLRNQNKFDLRVEGVGNGAIDYLESRVLEVNEGSVEGVEKIILGNVVHSKSNNMWGVDMEVYIK